ncbi:MAG: alpha/beta hydrolase [Chloroflexi bacterium]|nr:alpha/beta hydrolase [Chloroflexota bacterium]
MSEQAPPSLLAYEVTGSGPPLILLHGLSGSGRWWSRNVPAFAANFRTYTVDLPGFGQSRRARWSRLDGTADRLADWITAKGLPRAHIAGHSLGGAVAARLASRHPDCVDRLVLVDAAIQPEGTRRRVRPMDIAPTLRGGSVGFTPMLVRDLVRSHPRSFVTATVDALQTDWALHLTRITAPTLVVWGERDAITPLALGRGIAETITDAQLIVLPNAGHNPMWECAEAFNAEVLRFLRS